MNLEPDNIRGFIQRRMASKMKKNIFVIALILLFTSSVWAADYLIGEGDTLMISVWGEKDLTSRW